MPTAVGDSYRGFPVVATTGEFFSKFEPVLGEPWTFAEGRVFDGEDTAMAAVLANQIEAGDIVVIRYEGPKGGPGMREMLMITGAIKGAGLGKDVMLITDGRFSGGTTGLLVTNAAAGMTGEPLNHAEVLAAGQAAAERMGRLLAQVVTRL